MSATKELATIPSKHKNLDSILKSLNGASKTTRTTSQTSEIVPQFCSIAFNRIGLAFIGKCLMMPGIIDEVRIRGALIGIVLVSRQRGVYQRLKTLCTSIKRDLVPNDASTGSFNIRYHIDPFFFLPSNVYNSSISTTGSKWSDAGGGGGESGNVAACALTQLATV